MRPEDFAPHRRQHLVKVPEGWAFLPPDIPVDLRLSDGVRLLDGDARAAVGEMVGDARRVQNIDVILNPLRLREAQLTNEIEGTHTEIPDVLLQRAAPDTASSTVEIEEVLRAAETLEQGQHWLSLGRPLSVGLLRELHAVLLRSGRGMGRRPGEFRRQLVYVDRKGLTLAEARYVPPPPEHIAALVDSLMGFVERPVVYGPLIDAALMHYQFEAIHPFEDGNGRLGRTLIPMYLGTKRVLDQPLLYLSVYFATFRDQYIDLLHGVSTREAWEGWISFFLRGVISAARSIDALILRIDELRQRYRLAATRASRSNIPLQAIDHIMNRVYISVGDLEQLIPTSPPTARGAIDTLVKIGMIEPLGRRQGRAYWVASELLATAYAGDGASGTPTEEP